MKPYPSKHPFSQSEVERAVSSLGRCGDLLLAFGDASDAPARAGVAERTVLAAAPGWQLIEQPTSRACGIL